MLKDDHFIVGIGASAGGLEAIHELFDNIPSDTNFSFIIIQHLSPDYKSLMAELLTKHTRMEVLEVVDGMEVKPNCVYVIPNKKNIIIEEGKLLLVEKAGHAPNTAIDVFFTSLAKEKQTKAVGIVLSGTGTDGTKGVQAIKKAGGLVVVQDPLTAKFDGMPNSVLASGATDLILAPELMSEEIMAYIKQKPLLKAYENSLEERDEQVIREILEIIKNHTKCDFTCYKRPTIVRRLAKRMAINNHKSLEDYLTYLYGNSEEVNAVSKEFLIGVTKFFRDEEAFYEIVNKVIPEIVDQKEHGDLVKVWVAGCSTGEEAYSFAMLFDEYLKKTGKKLEVKIFATDIDREAIEFASKGHYGGNIVKEISPDRIEEYFIRAGKKFQVNQHLRKMVIFAHHDLIKDPPFGKIDLLSCRNLLIYLNPILQKKVMSIFNFSLNLKGFLFLGSSETPGDLYEYLEDVVKKWKIYRKVKASNNGFADLNTSKYNIDNRSVKVPVSFIARRNQHDDLAEILNDTILEEFNYSGVFVNESYELIQAMGNFRKFLQLPEKRLNLNLLKMVPEELAIALGASLRRAVKKQEKVVVNSIKYKERRRLRAVDVVIKPFFDERKLIPSMILVLFKENSLVDLKEPDYEEYDIDKQRRDRVSELELELKETKELLQATVEEQETANEELQSANEELISANEELQSTNEELQSLNEELHTVNTEHQLKIKELIELNDDLNNYFKSTNIGQVFVDKDLKIRKFTPAVTEQINLIESDINRSLGHISNNIQYEDLNIDILKVMQNNKALEKEILTAQGRWYQMRIFPYVRLDKQVDGAVINFVDITSLKDLNSLITGVINSSRNCIIALRAMRNDQGQIVDLSWLMLNSTAEKYLKVDFLKIKGKRFKEVISILNDQFLFQKFVEVIEQGSFLHVEHYVERSDEWFELVGVKMDDGIALTLTNITEKKESERKIRNAFEEVKIARGKLQKLNKELELRVEARTKALSVTEERFRILSVATNDAIKDWDLVNNTIWWNHGLEKMFGYAAHEVEKGIEFWQKCIHPDDQPRVLENLNKVINSGLNQWADEYRFRCTDGSYSYVLDRGYVLLDDNRMPYRMITSMADLTDLKKIQEDLKKTNDNLVRINSDLDNFIYTASHDLKAPISNIEGLVYSLEDVIDKQDDDVKTIIDMINDSIMKFKKTIKELTEITKIQKELVEDEEKIKIPDILEEVKFTIKDLIKDHQADLIEDLQAQEIHFSRKNLRSIFYNLLSNAIKYSSPSRKPIVHLRTYVEQGRFVISVEDNGLGIDPLQQGKVFSMFKRFHDHVDGSGVGMYIVKRIIENAGGKIALVSELDKGTTFTIDLPLKKEVLL